MDEITESLPFPLSPTTQETKHFCFIACVQSLLKDRGVHKTQREILEDFPSDLQKGHPTEEGAVKGLASIERVLIGYSLTKQPHLSDLKDSAEEMRDWLLERPVLWPGILILTTEREFHCVRLAKVRRDGFVVMDPKTGDFRFHQTEEFARQKPRFSVLECEG
jgi:hypothetical protein